MYCTTGALIVQGAFTRHNLLPPAALFNQMAFGEGPALAAGNSLDDAPMLNYARGLALVSNPNSPELEALAQERGWSVHRIGGSL